MRFNALRFTTLLVPLLLLFALTTSRPPVSLAQTGRQGGQNNAPIALDDAGRMFAVSPFQEKRFEINPLTYALIDDSTSYTMPGFTITGINGLAIHPTTGEIYAIIKLSGVSGRVLGTIDLETGVATMIGNLGANFSNLAFTDEGVLYGVTGDGATPPETLFTIDPVTAVPTLVMALGNGADGETIAFNPDDGLLYHSSGNGTALWEAINLETLTVIPIVGNLGTGEIFSIRYIGNNTFLTTDIASSVNLITTAGVVTSVTGGLADDYRGMIYDGSQLYQANEDTTLVITAAENHLLVNDFDADFDPLTAVLDTATTGAVIDLDSTGVFTYTPPLDFCGLDTFTYVVNDGQVDSPPADVFIEVSCLPDDPIAVDDVYTTTEEIPLTIPAPGVLSNDYDPDGPAVFTTTLLSPPAVGTVQFNLDGSFAYTPTLNFLGVTTFTYQIEMTSSVTSPVSDTATVTLHVLADNDAPIAAEDAYTTTEDTPLVISAPGVLENDSDPVENSSLTAVLNSTTSNGSLTLSSDGSFVYTPTVNFNGSDAFTYQAFDGEDLSSIVTVTLTVLSANDNPVVEAGSGFTTMEGTTAAFEGSFTDPGRVLNGGETILWDFGDGANASGTLTPIHIFADNGLYTVTLTVTDSLGGIGTDFLLVTVNNAPPTLEPLTNITVTVGTPASFAAAFADLGSADTHTATVDWGEGDNEPATVAGGEVSDSHLYATVGVYTVTVTLADDDEGQVTQIFVVTVIEPPLTGFELFLPLINRP